MAAFSSRAANPHRANLILTSPGSAHSVPGHDNAARLTMQDALRTLNGWLFILLPAAMLAVPARAELTDPRILAQLNALETASARANQASYDALLGTCEAGPGPACPDDVFGVFEETRELVQTANEILGTGDTTFSLGLDIDGLGFALRWTAAEEIAAQGSMTTEFAASQLSTLSARMSALRWGISGPRLTSAQEADGSIRVASSGTLPLGGGASADAEAIGTRWSWFVDGAFGYGEKDPTDLEPAFDFDGQEVTVGVDYRFSPLLAAGGDARLLEQGGRFRLLAQRCRWPHQDGRLQRHRLRAARRRERLSEWIAGLPEPDARHAPPHHLPVAEPAHSGGRQPRHARRRTAALCSRPWAPATRSAGAVFSIEPSLGLDYVDASVEGFRESSVDNTANASPDDPFDLQIGDQDIDSLDGSAGLQLQYVFTPRFGVLVPYLSARYHHELLDDVRRVSALYADALSRLIQVIDADFNVPTDPPDDDYYTAAAGVTVVLAGGLMGFVQYLQVLDLDDYSDAVITGGMRYEFGR